MNLKHWKQKLFPRGLRRDTTRIRSRFLNRTRQRDFVRAFQKLEIPSGALVCIHARLSSFGYLVGGPEIVIRALQHVVPDITVVMPTFPFSRTMQEYVAEDPIFNPGQTPSQSGLLSETFRQMPGVRRSRHPTHPSAALGPEAEALISGSEHADTPFGDQSVYGRYSQHPHAYQLLLDTNSTSIVHRFQEIAGWPNLFFDAPVPVRYLTETGDVQTTEVLMHRPRYPLYVALPDGSAHGFQYVWMPDYCLLFPERTRKRVANALNNPEAAKTLQKREEEFFRPKVFRRAALGRWQSMYSHG